MSENRGDPGAQYTSNGSSGVGVVYAIAIREVLVPILIWLLRYGQKKDVEPSNKRLIYSVGIVDKGARNRAIFVTAAMMAMLCFGYITMEAPNFYRQMSRV